MAELADALRAAQPFIYGLLALLTFARWFRLRDRASAWAAAMFVALALVIGISRVVDDDAGLWFQQVLIAVLVLFPYLLFRFAATFRPPGRRLEIVAGALTFLVAAGVFLFDDLPAGDEPATASFTAYTVLVAVQWVSLSVLVSIWLWRSAEGRPTVVRRRLRVLVSGIVALAGALLVAVAAGDADPGGVVDLVSSALAVIAGPLFLAGLAPPAVLLAQWRLPEEAMLQEAESGLVAATSPDEVAVALLPYVARTMGGDAAVLSRLDGTIVAYHGLDHDGAEALVAAAGDEGGPGDASVTSIPMRTGRLTVAGDRLAPFFGRGEAEVLNRLGSLTDVALRRAELTESERASAAELQRANDAMREFLSIASHDLRTPIAIIKGYSATMSSAWEAIDDADKQTYVATINRQADRLARLVTDLLTMSQLDAGAVDPEIGHVDLRDVVAEVVDDLDGGDDVNLDLPATLMVCADEDHGNRIVRNLVENAFRYGKPPVTVSATEAPGAVELRVRDAGPGVPEEFRPRLFERFARADDASDKAKHGTGLGLSIVRGLARAGGGEAWYEHSAPGACFVVRFPRADGEGS